jgi:hypothetical protein
MPVINGAGSYPPGLNFNELLLRVTEANDPKKLVEFFKTMTPPPDTTTSILLGKLLDASLTPKDTGETSQLLKMLLEDRKQDREEMSKLRDKIMAPPPPLPPQKSIIEQFIEIRPQIKELVDAFATKAGKVDVWASLAEKGIEQLPDLIELGRDFMKKDHAPAVQQQRTIETAAAPQSTPPTAETPEADARKYVDGMWKKWQGRLLGIASRLVEDFKTQDNGYYFRDWFLEMYGKLQWADLKRDIPPELLTNMYHAHPQLKLELAPPERLTAFLVQFFTLPGEEEADIVVEDEAGPVEQVDHVSAGKHGEANTK